jgi:hypothetical protein
LTLLFGFPPAVKIGAKLEFRVKLPASILAFHTSNIVLNSVAFSQFCLGKRREAVKPCFLLISSWGNTLPRLGRRTGSS